MAEAHIDYTLSKFPHERLLEVDDVTARVKWLCTPENSFKTDAVFDLSGDLRPIKTVSIKDIMVKFLTTQDGIP